MLFRSYLLSSQTTEWRIFININFDDSFFVEFISNGVLQKLFHRTKMYVFQVDVNRDKTKLETETSSKPKCQLASSLQSMARYVPTGKDLTSVDQF